MGPGRGEAPRSLRGRFEASLPRFSAALCPPRLFAWLKSFFGAGTERIFFLAAVRRGCSGEPRGARRELSSCSVGARGLRAGGSGAAPLQPKAPASRAEPGEKTARGFSAAASPAGPVPAEPPWAGAQRRPSPGLSPPSGQPRAGFGPEGEAGAVLYRVWRAGIYPAFWVFCPRGCVGVRADNCISSSYLLFFLALRAFCLLTNRWSFLHFHLFIPISYWWKGIIGTL